MRTPFPKEQQAGRAISSTQFLSGHGQAHPLHEQTALDPLLAAKRIEVRQSPDKPCTTSVKSDRRSTTSFGSTATLAALSLYDLHQFWWHRSPNSELSGQRKQGVPESACCSGTILSHTRTPTLVFSGQRRNTVDMGPFDFGGRFAIHGPRKMAMVPLWKVCAGQRMTCLGCQGMSSLSVSLSPLICSNDYGQPGMFEADQGYSSA